MKPWTNTRILGACGLSAAVLGFVGSAVGVASPPAGFAIGCVSSAIMLAANLVLVVRRDSAVVLAVRLDCPSCGTPHVDEGEFAARVHHKHLCLLCGHKWRVDPPAFGIARNSKGPACECKCRGQNHGRSWA